MERRLAAVFAADMVGYSRLMALDEAGTIARQKQYRTAFIDPKIAEFGGRIVKGTGDGVLVEFPSALDAVQCAAEIQRAVGRDGVELLRPLGRPRRHRFRPVRGGQAGILHRAQGSDSVFVIWVATAASARIRRPGASEAEEHGAAGACLALG